jgi:replicative DNA helicase
MSDLDLKKKVVAFIFNSTPDEAKQYTEDLIVKGVPVDVFKDVTAGQKGLVYSDTPISKLIDISREFYRVKRMALTRDIFIEELKRRKRPQEELQTYEALFNEIKSYVPIKAEFRYYCDRLCEVRDQNDLTASIQESLDHLERGGVKDAYAALRQRVLQIDRRQTSRESTRHLAQMSDEEREQYIIRKTNPELFRGIYTGWQELDEFTWGARQGELWIFTARTNVGKSIALGSIALSNYIDFDKNVVIATREMPTEQVRNRFAAREALIDYYKLRSGQLTPEEERRYFDVLEKRKARGNKLWIIPQTSCVDTVQIDIELRKILDEGQPDVLVVDYLNIIKPCGAPASAREDSIQGQIALELRDIAIDYKVPMFTATQDNRAATQGDIAEQGTETMALSDQIGRHADAIFRMFRTSTDKTNQNLRFKVIKGRDFEVGKEFVLRADFSKMLIADTLLGFDNV